MIGYGVESVWYTNPFLYNNATDEVLTWGTVDEFGFVRITDMEWSWRTTPTTTLPVFYYANFGGAGQKKVELVM